MAAGDTGSGWVVKGDLSLDRDCSIALSYRESKEKNLSIRKMRIKRKARQVINDYLIDGIPTGRRRYCMYSYFVYVSIQ